MRIQHETAYTAADLFSAWQVSTRTRRALQAANDAGSDGIKIFQGKKPARDVRRNEQP